MIAFVLLALRASHLTLIDPRGADRGEQQRITTLELPPERGLILDRNDAELAVTVQAPTIFAVPVAVENVPETARAVAQALGADPTRVETALRRGKSFSYVARWVTPQQAEAVRSLRRRGIDVMYEPRRVYPNRELGAHMIGFANIDGVGIRGIEEQENGLLRGRRRRFQVERDARNNLLPIEAPGRLATTGGDVRLTLDATLQADAERALDEAIAATGSKAGTAVSLDPRSGEILALAERPGFDPNRFRELHFPDTRSRAFLDAFEPGSTFKSFTIAAALEAGAVTLHDRFDCENGRFAVPGKLIRDSHPHGVLSVAEVLWVSSNICATKIGYRTGAPTLHATLRRFGFGRPTGSGFPNESAGLLRSWKNWRPVDHANVSFGQGVNVTPVQLAAATAAIANGGVWVTPHLVAARRAPGETFRPAPDGELRRVIRPETARRVLETLEGVVGTAMGTGKKARISGLRVAGKTGTAQKLDPVTKRYAEHRFVAWFTGIAPVDDPRLVVVVALDEPKGILHTGGQVAAPLFQRIASVQLARLGITGTREATLQQLATAPPPVASPPAPAETSVEESIAAAEQTLVVLVEDGRVLVPDLRGRSEVEVREALASAGIPLETEGAGQAVAQEPEAGTIAPQKSLRVRVRFAPGA